MVLGETALLKPAADAAEPVTKRAVHRQLLAHVRTDGYGALARTDIDSHRHFVLARRTPHLAKMYGLVTGASKLCIGQMQSHRLLRPADTAGHPMDLVLLPYSVSAPGLGASAVLPIDVVYAVDG